MIELTAKQYEALRALEEADGSIKKAAKALGIPPSALGGIAGRIRNKTGFDILWAPGRKNLLRKLEKQSDAEKAAEKKPFKRCDRPCKYRATEYAINGCDYLIITGQSRGCPPCDECTRFEEGERRTDILGEWKTHRGQTLEEADIYTIQRVKRRLHYSTSG